MSQGEYTVWCLLGRKAGDNTQVLALAAALGFGYTEKHISARPWELLTHLTLRVTLAGIDKSASSELAAPWPDLVITAGRRNEPVARWIQRQSDGQTKLVHLGRPWAPLDAWDLIITTPQYFLPVADNILHNQLPLHAATASADTAAIQVWREKFAGLPRPWIALLVGGDSGRFVLTPEKGLRLGGLADALAQDSGGALLVSDSPRTPKRAADLLQQRLQAPSFCFRFSEGGDNPYAALLALADGFVVTGESMSMLAEAADTGRPLFIFDPGDGDVAWWKLPHVWRYKPLSYRLAMRFGPARMRRDIGKIQLALVESGRGQWLRQDTMDSALQALQRAGMRSETADSNVATPAQLELARTVAEVRRLLTPR